MNLFYNENECRGFCFGKRQCYVTRHDVYGGKGDQIGSAPRFRRRSDTSSWPFLFAQQSADRLPLSFSLMLAPFSNNVLHMSLSSSLSVARCQGCNSIQKTEVISSLAKVNSISKFDMTILGLYCYDYHTSSTLRHPAITII